MDHVDDAPTSGVPPQQPRRSVTTPPRPPAPLRRRRRPLRTAGVVVLVLAVVALAAVVGVQRSTIGSTRHDLRSLQATSTAQRGQLQSLQAAAQAQRGQLQQVVKRLAAVQRSLTGLSGQLSTTHAQLQAAQTRLAADEKQLNLTTEKLPPDLTALAATVSPSVVVVSCTTATGNDTGTGFALDLPHPSGYATTVVTAEHVIHACRDAAAQGVLSLSTGAQTASLVKVRGADKANDVAVLDTSMKLPVLEPASDAPEAGEFLMAVGDALGMIENNVTSGNVSRVYDTYVVDTAPISNGNSGGPVVDRSGKVVGIVDASYVPNAGTPVAQNVNFSLRLSTLCLTLLTGPQCDALH